MKPQAIGFIEVVVLILAVIWIITGLFLVEPEVEKASAFVVANLWGATGVILSVIEKRGDV